jgi:hypothetical protein
MNPLRAGLRLFRRVLGTQDLLDRMRALEGQNAGFQCQNQLAQLALFQHYRELVRAKAPLPQFEDVEFRVCSQNGEDGILLYIFAVIGMTTRVAVEICAGDGIQCNAANLILNHGWTGLLVDGDPAKVERGRAFYANSPDTFTWPPAFAHAWVTGETVNDLITAYGIGGEIDLLSIDLDGVDWWVWKAIHVVRPRVVVAEYQDCWGPDQALTVPYSPDFRARWEHGALYYGGASLAAFVELGRVKGYRFVGAQRYGFNAFFVRNDLGRDVLPERPVADGLRHPKNLDGRQRQVKAGTLPWVDVRRILA